MVNSKENWNWGNLCKSFVQSEVCLLSSHVHWIPVISHKPERENDPETFIRTRKEHDCLWQEHGDYSQADYKLEHEERSPFSVLGMGRQGNPTWKEKKISPHYKEESRAKMKSVGLVLLGPRTETLCPASLSYLGWQDKGNGCALHTALLDRNMFSYCIFNWGHALAKKDQHGFDRRHIKIIFQYFVAEKCVCLEKGWICQTVMASKYWTLPDCTVYQSANTCPHVLPFAAKTPTKQVLISRSLKLASFTRDNFTLKYWNYF